jgi:hypothetical protein
MKGKHIEALSKRPESSLLQCLSKQRAIGLVSQLVACIGGGLLHCMFTELHYCVGPQGDQRRRCIDMSGPRSRCRSRAFLIRQVRLSLADRVGILPSCTFPLDTRTLSLKCRMLTLQIQSTSGHVVQWKGQGSNTSSQSRPYQISRRMHQVPSTQGTILLAQSVIETC